MFRPIFKSLCRSRLSAAIVAILAASALFAGGCSKGNEKAGGDEHDHHHHGEHPTVGPHGGQIIEWGDHEYHLEITFERDQRQATVHILDHDVKKPQPTAVSTPLLKLDGVTKAIPLAAAPLDGESGGKSSRYVATDAALAAAEKFAGAVSGVVDGTPYFGTFKEGDAKAAGEHDDHDGHGEHEEGHKEDHDGHDDDHKDSEHKDEDAQPHNDAHGDTTPPGPSDDAAPK